MRRRNAAFTTSVLALACILTAATRISGADPKAPKGDPATISIAVSPESVAPGGEAAVTVRLVPGSGIKINKYPRIKVIVPEKAGLVAASEASVGNDSAPPPDKLETNYFKTIDPVQLKLKLDTAAPKGRQEIDGKVSYFYCVAASGYCAPAKVAVKIPVVVR